MIALTKALDRWFGRGEFSITVPPLDGAFRANDALEAAGVVLEVGAPDGLAVTSRGLLASCGRKLIGINDPAAPAASFDAEIGAVAGLPDGGAAVGLVDGRIVFLGGQHDGRTIAAHAEIRCITALAPAADGALIVANGSATYAAADWQRDLMAKRASGSVWRLAPDSGAWSRISGPLAFPYGLIDEGGAIVVSESWRCALTRISPGGRVRPQTVVEALPAYPSRLSRGADDAIWLALFAPRSQLVEFVLSERRFRERMMAEIDPAFWVAPCLRSGQSALEPIQQGGVKQLGVLKPWSPSRSYGLIARLDGSYRPTASLHSRAHGHRHGVTSCLEFEGRLYFTAKGDGVVAALADNGATQ
ncbi:MAG TPA: hypothetical protein VN715_04030 [Roseiarcus sp.]|nr:hypothetical protein [Roseiarcus sp.]